MKFCMYCGSSLSDEAMFCNKCGMPAEPVANEAAAGNTPSEKAFTEAQIPKGPEPVKEKSDPVRETPQAAKPAGTSRTKGVFWKVLLGLLAATACVTVIVKEAVSIGVIAKQRICGEYVLESELGSMLVGLFGDTEQLDFVFGNDGKYATSSAHGEYIVDGDQLIMMEDGICKKYDLTLSGDRLVLFPQGTSEGGFSLVRRNGSAKMELGEPYPGLYQVGAYDTYIYLGKNGKFVSFDIDKDNGLKTRHTGEWSGTDANYRFLLKEDDHEFYLENYGGLNQSKDLEYDGQFLHFINEENYLYEEVRDRYGL